MYLTFIEFLIWARHHSNVNIDRKFIRHILIKSMWLYNKYILKYHLMYFTNIGQALLFQWAGSLYSAGSFLICVSSI